MADGLGVIAQGSNTNKTRESTHYQFLEGIGIKPNNDIATAPTNEDSIQFRLTTGGVLYYWDGNSWEIVNLSAIIAQSLNIGNTNLTLSSNRILNGGGFSFNIQNTSSTTIGSNGDTTIQAIGNLILRSIAEQIIYFKTSDQFTLGVSLDLMAADRTLKAPDSDGTIATENFVQENVNNMAVFSLLSDSDGIISDSSLIGKKIGLITGASVIYEEDFQFIKATGSDTILDALTNDPFVFLPEQKYFLTPILQ